VASDPPLTIDGDIHFPDGTTFRLCAEQYRNEPDEVVLILGSRIPISRMITEQRRVLRDFGHEVGIDRE
jgi:hypothetical protein